MSFKESKQWRKGRQLFPSLRLLQIDQAAVTSHVRLQQYVEKFGERAFCKVFIRLQLQTLCKAYGLQITARAKKSKLAKDLLPLIEESAKMSHPYYTNDLQSEVSVDDR